jgi:hypothetical protein
LRSGFLSLLLTGTWLTIRCLVISHSFMLKREPSVQLSAILATVGESHGRRGFQMTLKSARRGWT